MNTVLNYYSTIVQHIYRLALLQLYWLLFTCIGLFLFGLFPATYALLEAMKEPIDLTASEYFRKFKTDYKSVFMKINQAAILWMIMSLLMGTNLFIFKQTFVLQLLVLGLLFVILLSLVYFFRYFTLDMRIMAQVRRSFSYCFLFPKKNIIYLFIFFTVLLAIRFFPGIMFFFCASVTAQFIVRTWQSK